jgi:hypothetical protein
MRVSLLLNVLIAYANGRISSLQKIEIGNCRFDSHHQISPISKNAALSVAANIAFKS